MNLLAVLGVALGGAAGSALRFVVSNLLRAAPAAFPLPLGTLLVNLLGSLAIGLCAGWLERGGWDGVRTLVIAGFLGGFTTFSAFSLENLRLLRDGHSGAALGYILFSVCGGLLMAFAGYLVSRPPGG